jgi:hypothetical protein
LCTLHAPAAVSAGRCDSGQAAGLGCSLWPWRWEAAAIALKMAIRMNIFIGRFTVSVVTHQPARLLDTNLLSK